MIFLLGLKKSGGDMEDDSSMVSVNKFESDAGLWDVGFVGNPHEWFNNQDEVHVIWERLHRIFVNGIALNTFPYMLVRHLPHIESDHCPILFEPSNQDTGISFFVFQKAWLSHPGFLEVVRQNWHGRMHVILLLILA